MSSLWEQFFYELQILDFPRMFLRATVSELKGAVL